MTLTLDGEDKFNTYYMLTLNFNPTLTDLDPGPVH